MEMTSSCESMTTSPVSGVRRDEGGMDFERWVNQHMDTLKMKSMTADLTLTGVTLPKRLSEKMFKISADEKNAKGETLMISVIKYVPDELKQVQFLNILIRMGADINIGDTKNNRTPIMYAALFKRVSATRVLVNCPKLLLGTKDRLGNTALMYAALQGEKVIIDLIAIRLSKSWSFDIFLDRNRKGNTAEAMAVSNNKGYGADILRSTRVRMLQRMHKQLALIHYSAELRGWRGYTAAYRAAKIWQSKYLRRRTTASLPILNELNERWNRLNLTSEKLANEANLDRSVAAHHELLPNIYQPRSRSCVPFKHLGE